MSTPEAIFAATYVSSCLSNMRYDEEAPRVVDGFLDANEKPGMGESGGAGTDLQVRRRV